MLAVSAGSSLNSLVLLLLRLLLLPQAVSGGQPDEAATPSSSRWGTRWLNRLNLHKRSTEPDDPDLGRGAPGGTWGRMADAQHKLGHPPDRGEVGRASWTLLHTIAAQYPDTPTPEQRQDARSLIYALSRLYPCAECGTHFRKVLQECPPNTESRGDFSTWLCRVHNKVNRRLGKEVFDCSLLRFRWPGLECDDSGCELADDEHGR